MASEPDPALTGAAFELANAGYTPMPEMEKKDEGEAVGSDHASLREAAEQRSAPLDDAIVRRYILDNGKPAAPNEAISLERAARDYAGVTAAEKLTAESATSKELAARVDELRAEALAGDSDAAEFYGFEVLQPEAENTESEKPETPKAEANPTGAADATAKLDPDLEKVLQHPQIVRAIEEKIGEAEKARQDYLSGLIAATQIAQVSFLSQFPELAGVAMEGLPAALEQMSRQDPQKFARVQATIATTEQLFAEQQYESGREAELERQNFTTYAKSEDARLDTMLTGESKATQRMVSDESKIASDLAATEIAAQVSEISATTQYRIAEIGHWFEPDKLMGYCVAAYFGKLLIFDKVLGLGTTDPLAGFASVTSNLVVSFYFAKRGFENVARIIKR